MEGPGLRIMPEQFWRSLWVVFIGGSCVVVPGDSWHPAITTMAAVLPRCTSDEPLSAIINILWY